MITKKRLYEGVHQLKIRQFGNPDLYGMDIIGFVQENGVQVRKLRFKTKGLRGMAVPGGNDERDIILLNKRRTPREQNMDCAHEVIHLAFHSSLKRKTFNCFDGITANQDCFIEWQANEGGAEYCVPYKSFIPIVCSELHYLRECNAWMFKDYCYRLGELFNVPDTMIAFRMNSLRYEMYQYLQGVSLDEIELTSNRELERRKIKVESIFDVVLQNQAAEEADIIASIENNR